MTLIYIVSAGSQPFVVDTPPVCGYLGGMDAPTTDMDALTLTNVAAERLEAEAAQELANNLVQVLRLEPQRREYVAVRTVAHEMICHRIDRFGLRVHHVAPLQLAHELAEAWIRYCDGRAA